MDCHAGFVVFLWLTGIIRASMKYCPRKDLDPITEVIQKYQKKRSAA